MKTTVLSLIMAALAFTACDFKNPKHIQQKTYDKVYTEIVPGLEAFTLYQEAYAQFESGEMQEKIENVLPDTYEYSVIPDFHEDDSYLVGVSVFIKDPNHRSKELNLKTISNHLLSTYPCLKKTTKHMYECSDENLSMFLNFSEEPSREKLFLSIRLVKPNSISLK